MSNVLNRTTKEFRASANEPDFPLIDWIWNPDLSAVAGFGSQYWIITGDVVTLMDATQRAAVDAANLVITRDTSVSDLDQVEGVLRAFMLVVRDELNLHADKMNAIMTAIDNSTNYATLKSNIGAIVDYPQRTIAQLRTSIRNKLGS